MEDYIGSNAIKKYYKEGSTGDAADHAGKSRGIPIYL